MDKPLIVMYAITMTKIIAEYPTGLTIFAQGTETTPELPSRYHWSYRTAQVTDGVEVTVAICKSRSPRMSALLGEGQKEVIKLCNHVSQGTLKRFPRYLDGVVAELENEVFNAFID